MNNVKIKHIYDGGKQAFILNVQIHSNHKICADDLLSKFQVLQYLDIARQGIEDMILDDERTRLLSEIKMSKFLDIARYFAITTMSDKLESTYWKIVAKTLTHEADFTVRDSDGAKSYHRIDSRSLNYIQANVPIIYEMSLMKVPGSRSRSVTIRPAHGMVHKGPMAWGDDPLAGLNALDQMSLVSRFPNINWTPHIIHSYEKPPKTPARALTMADMIGRELMKS